MSGERIVATDAVDFAPYWRATAGRLHRVTGVHFVWRGPDADRLRPRVIVNVACRSLSVGVGRQFRQRGLTCVYGGDLCPTCFCVEEVAA